MRFGSHPSRRRQGCHSCTLLLVADLVELQPLRRAVRAVHCHDIESQLAGLLFIVHIFAILAPPGVLIVIRERSERINPAGNEEEGQNEQKEEYGHPGALHTRQMRKGDVTMYI